MKHKKQFSNKTLNKYLIRFALIKLWNIKYLRHILDGIE